MAPQRQPVGNYRKDHLPELDGLRGIAVLLVLWQHVPVMLVPYAVFRAQRAIFGEMQNGEWPVYIDGFRDSLLRAGYLGVDVFFVLSGFLITRILLVDKAAAVPLRHFLARRFLRIFPIYYLTLGVAWLVRPAPDLPYCAAYLSNFYYSVHGVAGAALPHSWSLAVEEHFYLLWPPAVYLCSDRRALRIAAYVVVPGAIACAVCCAWYWRDEPSFLTRLLQCGTPFRALSLTLGALLAFGESRVRANRSRWLVVGLAAIVVGYALHVVPPLGGRSISNTTTFSVLVLLGFALTSFGLVTTAIVCSAGGSVFARILRGRLLRWVGKISYGLYLYHFVVFAWTGVHALKVDDASAPLHMAIAIVIAFVVATLSFRFIERPILRYAARFRSVSV